jgi:adenylate cyclase
MDYFGPMVNRAARIEGVADGGQICVSSDFISEVQRMLESHIDSDRTGSTGSEDTLGDDLMTQAIRRELRSLSSQGFEVKDLGQRNLKGLENPEYIYLMYPHSLASRLVVQAQKAEAETRANQQAAQEGRKSQNSSLTIDTENVWDLWNVSLRLEMLCSTLECTGSTSLKPPETALLEWIKQRGGEVTDRFLVNFVEHQISRIEVSFRLSLHWTSAMLTPTLDLYFFPRPSKHDPTVQGRHAHPSMSHVRDPWRALSSIGRVEDVQGAGGFHHGAIIDAFISPLPPTSRVLF